jgi:alpha-tubulin suppressor-like RCC1 family protein
MKQLMIVLALLGTVDWGQGEASLPAHMAATGEMHFLLLDSKGAVWAWGLNSYGQLGDGSTVKRPARARVIGLHNAVAVAAGAFHSLALDQQGQVWGWGLNLAGQVEPGASVKQYFAPVLVAGLSNVHSISAGEAHSLALKNDGTVWTWGSNSSGQLGNGTTDSKKGLAQVQGLQQIVAASAGSGHSLAASSDGTVWAWGKNSYGQIGDGTTGSRKLTPVRVAGMSGALSVSAGYDFSVAADREGKVWAWGRNVYGQLGDGTAITRRSAVAVKNLGGITQVVSGKVHTVALAKDGTLWAWGSNDLGQLGDGTTTDRSVPVQVKSIQDVVGIAAGPSTTLAIDRRGRIWVWGRNVYGPSGQETNRLPSLVVELPETTGSVR